MPSMPEIIPNVDDLLDLGPEEVGGKILQVLNLTSDRKFNLLNSTNQLSYKGAVARYSADGRVFRAWLRRGGGWKMKAYSCLNRANLATGGDL